MKLLDYDALADKGIKFSDTHIWRLIRAGDFPNRSRSAIATIGSKPRSISTSPTSWRNATVWRRRDM